MDIKKKDKDFIIKIGKQIRKLRQDKDLSQEKLAFLSGLDITYINDIENGKRNFSIVVFRRILEALSVNPNDFQF